MFVVFEIREEQVYGYGGWTDQYRREFDIIGYFYNDEDAAKFCRNTNYDYEFVENLGEEE